MGWANFDTDFPRARSRGWCNENKTAVCAVPIRLRSSILAQNVTYQNSSFNGLP